MSKKEPPKQYNLHRTLSTTSTRARRPVKKVGQTPDKKTTTEKKRLSKKKIVLLALLVLLMPILIIGIWDIRNASDASQKMFGTSNVLSALLTEDPDRNENGRTNILLIGYSADDPEHAGALLTDSIMIMSLDKEQKSGYMLSVPRDLYVKIPDYGSAKINEAFQAGEQQGTGGAVLLRQVVSEHFGIELHNHVIINYSAVRDIVNALDGITVNIKSPDPRGLYDPNFKPDEGGPLMLTNGMQEIDGQTALRLTRARGSTFGSYGFPQSDFNRTQNQQIVISGIKQKLDWKLILDPRLNDDFFDAVANNVATDLTLGEVLPVYRLLRSIPDSNMKQVNLSDVDDVNYLSSYTTRSGQSALIPAAGTTDFSDIKSLIRKLTD